MEQSKVIRSAFKIGGFTSISRVLGLIRDTLTAAAFGTSGAMSAFVVAFRIPNLFQEAEHPSSLRRIINMRPKQ